MATEAIKVCCMHYKAVLPLPVNRMYMFQIETKPMLIMSHAVLFLLDKILIHLVAIVHFVLISATSCVHEKTK